MTTKKKTQRQLQASQQIKKILAEIFAKEGYSQIAGSYVTILEADISPDFKNCKIYVDVFGEGDKDQILTALNGGAKNFRREIGKELVMRVVPEIRFVLDETSQYALDIASLIEEEKGKRR